MHPENTPQTFSTELPTLSRAEIAHFVKQGERMRAEAQAELLRSAGRGIARLSRAVSRPLRLAWLRRREYLRVRAELETYSAASSRPTWGSIAPISRRSPAAEPIDRHAER
jgi:hypothetical protein